MIQPLFNWKTGIALIAIAIVSGTIFYSQFLANKIAREERGKVQQWVEASRLLVTDTTGISDNLSILIVTENKTIPIIVTDENDRVLDFVNLDSAAVAQDSNYVYRQLKQFKERNPPLQWVNPADSTEKNLYYYGHTTLLNQVRYYPLVQLFIVTLFIIITLTALTTGFKSAQNQLWAGMAKETAHQLGTPLTSLQGWVEMLKEDPRNAPIVQEMEKDVDRLKLVSDRFGKIGSTPHLEDTDVLAQVNNVVEYIRKRAPGKVQFVVHTHGQTSVMAPLSAPLFDWVIENLLKNALDAMEGKGQITIDITSNPKAVQIDVTDTGKGISAQHIRKVFKPGFTTKKRGWGLGLSLSRRIIEHYHKGQIFVKASELGKGTTFRVVLRREG